MNYQQFRNLGDGPLNSSSGRLRHVHRQGWVTVTASQVTLGTGLYCSPEETNQLPRDGCRRVRLNRKHQPRQAQSTGEAAVPGAGAGVMSS